MILIREHWLKDINGPDDIDPRQYLGRKFKVLDDNKKERIVVCEEVQGSLAHPSKFQINYKGESYLISMLDFFGQAEGHQFTKKEIEEFENLFHGAVVRKNGAYKRPGKRLWTPPKRIH